MERQITHRYRDPLDEIWLAAARGVGLRVERTAESYASTDGAGTLFLSDRPGMDADDCLAQMILHELCHALVQGGESFHVRDWGLDNWGDRDTTREHACLRLQAALLEPLGLRLMLAPTTDFRPYYDALPPDPFEERALVERESITRARAGYARRHRRPWHQHLESALTATRDLAAAAGPFAEPGSLLSLLRPSAPRHASGLYLHPDRSSDARPSTDGASPVERRCGTCAWAVTRSRSHDALRCRQAAGRSVKREMPACERFENSLDCGDCGACCREAYDTVEVAPRDPVQRRHLSLLSPRTSGYDMRRDGSRCVCLKGGLPLSPGGDVNSERAAPPLAMPGGAPFTCSIYDERPRTCRDFAQSSQHCLDARRTVGLSR